MNHCILLRIIPNYSELLVFMTYFAIILPPLPQESILYELRPDRSYSNYSKTFRISKFSAFTLHICTLFQIPSSVPSKPPFSPVLQSYPAPNNVPDDLAFAVRDR